MATALSAPVIRAVAFDLDGLILNTEHVFAIAAEEMLARRGLPMPPGLLRGMMGRRPPEGFRIMADMLGLTDSPETLEAEAKEDFFRLLETRLTTMPGVHDLLEHIEQSGLPKAVATSSPRRYLDDLLGRVGLLDRFSFALTAEDVVLGKPNPEIYLKAAERLGVAPQEMLVLEDSETGTRAGVAAGACVVSVPHEFSQSHDFSSAFAVSQRGLQDQLIFSLITSR